MTPAAYYSDPLVSLYHGDCRELVPLLDVVVDHVITDPPFSGHAHASSKSNRDKGYANTAINFEPVDYAAIDALLWMLAPRCRRWFIGTLDWRHIAALESSTPTPWEFVRFGVWVKTNPMPQMTGDRPANGWDGIAYLHKRDIKKRWHGGGDHGNWIGPVVTNGLHPTGKPEAFIERFIAQFTDEGDLILDPFAGSGTTAVVAKRMGRRCIAIELDEQYCNVAARRLSIRFDDIAGGLFENIS